MGERARASVRWLNSPHLPHVVAVAGNVAFSVCHSEIQRSLREKRERERAVRSCVYVCVCVRQNGWKIMAQAQRPSRFLGSIFCSTCLLYHSKQRATRAMQQACVCVCMCVLVLLCLYLCLRGA